MELSLVEAAVVLPVMSYDAIIGGRNRWHCQRLYHW